MQPTTGMASVLVLAGLCAAFAMPEQKRSDPKSAAGTTTVVLKKRTSNDTYGASAYSFRYSSQDEAVHGNQVDLLFNNCGLMHVSPESGTHNRVAKAKDGKLSEVVALSKGGWMTESIKPEKGANYIMEIDDGTTHQRVKFQITAASDTEVSLEWAPFRDGSIKAGTMGKCGMPPHGPK